MEVPWKTSLGTSSLPMLQLCRAASGLSLGRASAAPRLLQPVLSAIPPSALHAAPAGAALKRPLCTNAASAGGSAAVPPESPAASASDEELPYAPRHGRRLLRTRIDAALRAARAGAELSLPEPEREAMPGPCFAVLDVLGERGVMSLPELYDAVETKYPGVLRGKRYLKHRVRFAHESNSEGCTILFPQRLTPPHTRTHTSPPPPALTHSR